MEVTSIYLVSLNRTNITKIQRPMTAVISNFLIDTSRKLTILSKPAIFTLFLCPHNSAPTQEATKTNFQCHSRPEVVILDSNRKLTPSSLRKSSFCSGQNLFTNQTTTERLLKNGKLARRAKSHCKLSHRDYGDGMQWFLSIYTCIGQKHHN